MTKEDILKMDKSQDIMKALANHRDLWDLDTDMHLREVKKKELVAQYGTHEVFYEIPRRKK